MKIRISFVSNSSSSSFCIIGIKNEDLLKQLAKAEGKDFSWDEGYDEDKDQLDYGRNEAKVVIFYGYDQPEYAGIDIDGIDEDKSIKQIKKDFVEVVKKKLKVDIPISKVKIFYGEAGDG